MQAKLGVNVRRNVDREIISREHRARGDQGENTDERFGHHSAVANHASVRLFVNHLRSCAGAHQRVESRNSAAGYGDEKERKKRSFDNWAAAMDVWRYGRELNVGMNEQNSDNQNSDRPELHVGREIIARFEEQPDRKNGGYETVSGHQDCDLVRGESEMQGKRRQGDPTAYNNSGDQQNHAHRAGQSDFYLARGAFKHVKAHGNRDRNCAADGEDAPRTVGERVDDNDSKAGHRDYEYKKNANH